MFRRRDDALEVFLVHPGGPFFKNKDDGAWSVPKGEIEAGEDPLATARREFTEETGFDVPESGFLPLGAIQQKGGKVVAAWAFEGDVDPAALKSNSFELEWPPRSGRKRRFPEVDRAAFFSSADARIKINPAQSAFIDRLEDLLTKEPSGGV